ncbi:MAG: ROK family transcriptional regulator [Terracidiphilus sp.]|jgi:predicted NBD/HSP70 family sugar kinase
MTGIRHVDLTDTEVASSETARRINRDIILELIRENQPTSRIELSRSSGLQKSTVSQIVEQLISENWVVERAVGTTPRGRRPTLLGLNERVAAIAVDIHPRQAIVAVVDLNGRLLSQCKVPVTSDPAASTRLIVDCIRRFKAFFTDRAMEGIGVSLPGRVDPATQRLTFAPNLRWPDFDLKGALEAEFGLAVNMENAATACLLAELTFGRMDGIRDIVLVAISEGIGAGVFADGRIISGNRGMAGEFGHISLDPEGPRCGCGRKGCWEMYASCRAAVNYFRKRRAGNKAVSFHELLKLAEEGSKDAQEALERQAQYIARGLRIIIASLSPAMILIAGEITSAWHRFERIIEKEVKSYVLAGAAPRIIPTHEGEIARLRGAAALVFQRQIARPQSAGAAGSRRG